MIGTSLHCELPHHLHLQTHEHGSLAAKQGHREVLHVVHSTPFFLLPKCIFIPKNVIYKFFFLSSTFTKIINN